MKFAHPLWLIAVFAVIPVLLWTFRRFNQARLLALKRFASERLIPKLTANVSLPLRSLKRGLFIVGVALCVFALARPQLGFHWKEVKRKGIDILFAVDTSRSMLAQDVNPDRLTRAKLAVLDLVAKLPGDRVGLVAFAGTSFLQCPLTLDYDAFRQSLEALDSAIIPQGGSDLASAIHEAEKAFQMGSPSHKILVLLTDGEDLEANGIAAAKEAAQQGMKIFTVGVGTSNGELIPIRNESGGVEFLKNDQGQAVKSRLDESILRQMAEATGGFYEPLGQQGQGLEAVYDRGLSVIPKQELASRMDKIYTERFQWPLAAGILCLVLEMLLGDRRRLEVRGLKWKIPNWKAKTGGVKMAALGIFGLWAAYPMVLMASPQSAEKAYQQGKFKEAVAQYKTAAEKNPKKTELQFNLGTSAYKTRQYPEAAAAFQKALHTDQVPLQQQTFYNLGNTQYRLGQQIEKSDPQQTIQAWQQAVQSYESALKLKPDDGDAKHNYEYVKKKLEELQKQHPQDPEKDQKQNKDENKESQNKDSSGKENTEAKDQKEPSQGNDPSKDKKDAKDKKGESPDKNKPKEQNSQAQKPTPSKPEKPKDGEQPQPSNGRDSAKQSPGERDPQPLPGQMNKEEAKNLLDSLKGDEKKMPATPASSGPMGGADDSPKRDW